MSIITRCLAPIRAGVAFLRAYGQHLPQAGKALFSLPCSVIQVRGVLSGDQGEVLVTYLGRRINDQYLFRMICTSFEIVEDHRCTLLTYHKPFRRLEATADVVVVDLGWPYSGLFNRKRGWIKVPDWVNLELSLKEDWSDVQGRFRQTARSNDLPRIRRTGYTWDVTQDRGAAEEFYDEMYVPFVQYRHQGESIVEPRRIIVKRVIKGGLLRVYLADRVVAAGVVFSDGGGLHFLWLGMPREYLAAPPDFAISALYLFGIQHAHKQGLDYVNFTGTRGFLGDGAFKFKKKWGGVVEDTFSPGSVLFKPGG